MKFALLLILVGTAACSSIQTTNACLFQIDADKYKFDTQYKNKQLDDAAYMIALMDLMVEVDAKQIQNENAKKDGFNYCAVDWQAERWSIQESFDSIAVPKRMR
jgi:hypothetical protein